MVPAMTPAITPETTPETIMDVSTGAPDPRDAALRCERVLAAAAQAAIELQPLSEDTRTVLTLCCQRAPYLATLLARDPARLSRVASSPYLRREKPAEIMSRELADALAGCAVDDTESLRRILRRYRAEEMVRLGVRELGLGNASEVGRELAHLADVCFDAAIVFHDLQLRARYGPPRYTDDNGVERDAELVVIGMGKLGGEELNFSSDVDVIYIYSSDAGSAGDISLHEYFSKLCKLVTASIGEVTDDEVVFRVDLRLRPEGSKGPIANSLPSTERYYETWGRPWERQAWLKARPCAGSLALGSEVMDTLRPFIYPRSTSPTIIDEVNELNRRIKRELDGAGLGGSFDVKNGVGGIREIEFFVQALQLIHAGHQPALRARGTLVALDQLLFAGLLTETEHRALGESYRFLRRAEHVLQLEGGRQTQKLPRAPAALEVLAGRLDYPDAEAFGAALSAVTAEVARLFSTLGAPEPGPPDEVAALLAGDLEPEAEIAILGKLGFRSPEAAWRELDLARRKPLSPFAPAARDAAARIAPGLLAEIIASPDPDQALRHVTELAGKRSAFSSMWRLFDDNPPIMRRVVSLFGTSAFLAKYFVQHPQLVDVLVDIGRSAATRTVGELARALEAQQARADGGDEEGQWDQLALFKNAQILRIGLADIGGELDSEAVSDELSKVAEVCLARAYEMVQQAMLARHGAPRDRATGERATLSVLGLGKLGGRELGYASDLDVLFVYSADGQTDGARGIDNLTYMTRLAQRMMSGLHAMHPGGRLYELDTRLRPSGSQGLLVSSLAAWHNYHRGAARLWERQALIKLRPVAGDPELGARVAAAAAEYVYSRAAHAAEPVAAPGEEGVQGRQGDEHAGAQPGDEHARARSIAMAVTSMRDKIERELAGSQDEQDIKTGRGGLIDIEFASQYLQLVHGPEHPDLRTRSTVPALRAAAELGLAAPGDCALLIDGYRFLRTLEHRMRIVHDRSVQRLPREPEELDKLARRAGYAGSPALLRDYAHWTREVRSAYVRLIQADLQRAAGRRR
jgi:glutamate-ammonia-ligase adenylyltransferase